MSLVSLRKNVQPTFRNSTIPLDEFSFSVYTLHSIPPPANLSKDGDPKRQPRKDIVLFLHYSARPRELTIISGTPGKAPVTEDETAAPVVETTTTSDKEIAAPVEAETVKTVEKDVQPAVEHETIVKEHEQKEQTVVDKERHQDHYHTTVQPVKDSEVLPEDHRYEETATEVKDFDHDDGAAKIKDDARKADFENTTEQGKTVKTTTEEPTAVAGETVHHHLHETVQPVIEKGTISETNEETM